MKHLLSIITILSLVSCHQNSKIKIEDCDSTIKRIVIQQLDSSFWIIETKDGVAFNEFHTDSLPDYHYVWIQVLNGLPYKSSKKDTLTYCTGFSSENDFAYFLKKNALHDTIYRTKVNSFGNVESVHIGSVYKLNQQ